MCCCGLALPMGHLVVGEKAAEAIACLLRCNVKIGWIQHKPFVLKREPAYDARDRVVRFHACDAGGFLAAFNNSLRANA